MNHNELDKENDKEVAMGQPLPGLDQRNGGELEIENSSIFEEPKVEEGVRMNLKPGRSMF